MHPVFFLICKVVSLDDAIAWIFRCSGFWVIWSLIIFTSEKVEWRSFKPDLVRNVFTYTKVWPFFLSGQHFQDLLCTHDWMVSITVLFTPQTTPIGQLLLWIEWATGGFKSVFSEGDSVAWKNYILLFAVHGSHCSCLLLCMVFEKAAENVLIHL